jgi:hypothetical protein
MFALTLYKEEYPPDYEVCTNQKSNDTGLYAHYDAEYYCENSDDE